MADLPERIKKLRLEKNYSQTTLCEELGIGLSTVAMWETGKRFPTRENLEALADIFNVDVDYILGRTDLRQKVHFDNDGNMMIHSDFFIQDDEMQLLMDYRDADQATKEMVVRILKYSKMDSEKKS